MDYNDKFIPFLAVTPNKQFFKLFKRAGVQNILISYYYIRKNKRLAQEFMDYANSTGGLVMVDSGVFTLLEERGTRTLEDYEEFMVEYVNYLQEDKDRIFCACNFDLDHVLGYEKINEWNVEFFEPLQEHINIIYVVQVMGKGKPPMNRFKEYAEKYKYLAINESSINYVQQIYQLSKKLKVSVHGLAWTKPTKLKQYPFFSVDSSSWVGYQKFGSTVYFDGREFYQYDNQKKDIRKSLKKYCDKYEVSFYEYVHEKDRQTKQHNDSEGLTFSIKAWLEVLNSLKKIANFKLKTKIKDLMKNADENTLPETIGAAGSSSLASMIDSENENSVTLVLRDEAPVDIATINNQYQGLMMCNNCMVASECPFMKENSTCKINFSLPKDMPRDPMVLLDFLIEKQTERVQRTLFMEKMEGGTTNRSYTSELNFLKELSKTKADMIIKSKQKSIKLTQTIEATDSGNGGGGFKDMLKGMLSDDSDNKLIEADGNK